MPAIQSELLEGRLLLDALETQAAATGALHPAALADLAPALFVPSTQTMPGLTTLSVTFSVQNSSSSPAGAFGVEFFWSADANFSNGDEVPAPLSASDPFYQPSNTNAVAFSALAGTSQTTRVVTVLVPASPLVGTSGICFLGIRVDEGNTVPESDEANNSSLGPGTSESRVFWAIETYRANMASDPGWSLQGGWAYGVPSGNAGDPVSGSSGAAVVGYNLNGAYADGMAGTDWATTPAISTVGYSHITISFMRWVNIEEGLYDKAYVAASTNGTTWTTLWTNPLDTPLHDDHWVPETFALPSTFDDRPAIYVRWGIGPTDFMVNYGGWNIDDVVIRGQAGVSATPTAPDLLAASDTGSSDSDNLTRLDNSSALSRLTFRVGGTVPGATVTLYCDAVPIGSAVAAGSTTDVTTNGSWDIADGVHQFVARQTQPGMSESLGSAGLSVSIDTVPPTQTSFTVAEGAIQRSMVDVLQVVFSEEVSVAGALVLRTGSGASVTQVTLTVTNPSLDRRTYIGTFFGSAVQEGSLPDGRYILHVDAAGVGDMAGNSMADNRTNRFHRLFGDADGDLDVDNSDLAKFRQALKEPANYAMYWYFDYDNDGSVNNADYAQFKQRLVRRIPS